MIKAERESFFKSFGVFFLSLALLSGGLLYLEYTKQKYEIEEKIYNSMRVCSYDLKCTEYEFDFVPLESKKLYKLNKLSQDLSAFFPIPKNEKYALKLTLLDSKYQLLLKETQYKIAIYYLWVLVVIVFVSTLFSAYALYPLRRALHLTEEFSRDILHDLNTPLSTLRLNISRLKIALGDEKKIQRISQSIDTIISLGDNLRAHIENHTHQCEKLSLSALLQERLPLYEKLYPNISFTINSETLFVNTHKDALTRIIDNLLDNAGKYNTANGLVAIEVDAKNRLLKIQDSGKGVKNPKKIFERFYKEQERGVGIGLHIVKKFCNELKISIHVESSVGKGTLFILDFSALTHR